MKATSIMCGKTVFAKGEPVLATTSDGGVTLSIKTELLKVTLEVYLSGEDLKRIMKYLKIDTKET